MQAFISYHKTCSLLHRGSLLFGVTEWGPTRTQATFQSSLAQGMWLFQVPSDVARLYSYEEFTMQALAHATWEAAWHAEVPQVFQFTG